MPGNLSNSLSGSRISLTMSTCTSNSRESVTGLRREKPKMKFHADPADVYGVQPKEIAAGLKSGFHTRKRSNSTLTTLSGFTSETTSSRSAVSTERRRNGQQNSKPRQLSASNYTCNHTHRIYGNRKLSRRNSSKGSHPNRETRARTASTGDANNNGQRNGQPPKLKPKARRQIAHREAYRMFLYQAFRQWRESSMTSSAIASFVGDYKQVTHRESASEIKTLAQLEKLLYETLESLDKVNLKGASSGRETEGRLLSYLQRSVREFLVRPLAWRGLERVKRTNMVKQYNATIDKWFYGPEYKPEADKDSGVHQREKHDQKRIKDKVRRARTPESTNSDVTSTITSCDTESVTSSALSDSTNVTCDTLNASSDSGSFHSFTSDDDDDDTSSSEEDDDDTSSSEEDEEDDDDDFETTTSSSGSSQSARETPTTAHACESADGRHDDGGHMERMLSSRRSDSSSQGQGSELPSAPLSDRPIVQEDKQSEQKSEVERQEEIKRLVHKVTGIMRFYNLVQDKLYEREIKNVQADQTPTRKGPRRLNHRDLDTQSGSSPVPRNQPLLRSTSEPANGDNGNRTKSAVVSQNSNRNSAKTNNFPTVDNTAESSNQGKSDRSQKERSVSPHGNDTGVSQPKKSANRKLIKNRKQNEIPANSSPLNTRNEPPLSQEEATILTAVDKYFEDEDKLEKESKEEMAESQELKTDKALRPYVRFPSLDQYDMTKTRKKKFYMAQT